MVKVAILGATGYTSLELIKILLRHPHAEISVLTTRQEGRPPVHSIHQSLFGRLDLRCEDLEPSEVCRKAEFIFCCLPHVASMEAVPDLLAGGCRVVDLSADYRLNNPVAYETWYGHAHSDPARLGKTVYGLPELWGERIPGQSLVANPGCYTSAAILGLAPLIMRGIIDATGIIIDAKSGVSGAGRTPRLNTLFPECNEAVAAYSVGNVHRHLPEIEQVLSEFAQTPVEAVFTPHLVPMDRGILSTLYATPLRKWKTAELVRFYKNFYRKEK